MDYTNFEEMMDSFNWIGDHQGKAEYLLEMNSDLVEQMSGLNSENERLIYDFEQLELHSLSVKKEKELIQHTIDEREKEIKRQSQIIKDQQEKIFELTGTPAGQGYKEQKIDNNLKLDQEMLNANSNIEIPKLSETEIINYLKSLGIEMVLVD